MFMLSLNLLALTDINLINANIILSLANLNVNSVREYNLCFRLKNLVDANV